MIITPIRYFAKIVLLHCVFLFLHFTLQPAQAEDATKPNVLLILVDDLKPTLGCYGDSLAISPNIDRIASRGMRFEMAYCNQAVCAPSRFNLMLGAHSTSTGLYGLGSHLRELVPDAVTLPQYFAKHGYRTESLGKVFHIGHGNEGDPQSFSVPHFKDKVIEYLDPESTDGGLLTREEALFTNQKLGEIRSLPRGAAFEAPVAEDDAYADGRVANETIRRLQQAKQRRLNDGTPFLIAAGFVRPHLPFSAPKKYWDLYDESEFSLASNPTPPANAPAVALKRGGEIAAYKPVPADGDVDETLARKLIHGYYASTSYVDAQIGKVIDELDRLNLSDNTIVVLWGDHGFHLGDLGIWTKHTNYEQANRIPLLISAPGITEPGSATAQLAETVDIYPTLAALAGLQPPQGPQMIDGVSLLPVLKDSRARVRDHAYHIFPRSKLGRAIRTDRYRMVQWKGHGEPESKAVYELYDYQVDPLERTNLANEQPEVLETLQKILADYPEPYAPAAKRSAQRVRPATDPMSLHSPEIRNQPIRAVVEVVLPKPNATGVVLAQGGREHGYAVHFVAGHPVFDVRVNGKVTRIQSERPLRGRIKIEALLDSAQMQLIVNDKVVATATSPGLIPVQPKDSLSVGFDELSAAGDYEAPNPFSETVISVTVAAAGDPAPVAEAMAPEVIKKRLADHNRAVYVKEGWIRDPFIVHGPDDWFYLTGTTPLPSDPRQQTDPYNTGLGEQSIVGWKAQVWRTRDFIDWESLDAPYSLKDGIWYEAQREAFDETDSNQWFLWAPELHWVGDRWALIHTSPSPVNGANLSLTTGKEVKGPWTNPMGVEIARRHDPSLFQDDDGTWWMVWGATKIAPLKADFSGLAGEEIEIGPSGEMSKMGHEGCLLHKIHDKYVLFGTGWSTGQMRRGSYNLYYATADSIAGPYSERKFVGRFLGHGTPFQDRLGRWWCTAFYNANVPPLTTEGIEMRDLSITAQTINQRGTTLVPLEVRLLDDGELLIRAKDPDYAKPGPDEAQDFGL